MKKIPTSWWIMGFLLAIAGLFTLSAITGGQAHANLSNRQVALICTTDMATQFHTHPHLQIVINGAPQVIPADIGISASCMHPLHTHDASGEIHVESPQQRDFTLADFFAVWGQPFNKNQILDAKIDASHIIRVTVAGQQVDTYEDTVLHDQDQIVISYEGIK